MQISLRLKQTFLVTEHVCFIFLVLLPTLQSHAVSLLPASLAFSICTHPKFLHSLRQAVHELTFLWDCLSVCLSLGSCPHLTFVANKSIMLLCATKVKCFCHIKSASRIGKRLLYRYLPSNASARHLYAAVFFTFDRAGIAAALERQPAAAYRAAFVRVTIVIIFLLCRQTNLHLLFRYFSIRTLSSIAPLISSIDSISSSKIS